MVIITPSSLRKPWTLWEAGAVDGTAIVSGDSDTRSVRPVIFRVTPEQVPDPLPTEPVVQEWTLRLDELRRQNRTSEVKNLHEWLNIAFGRKEEDVPLDIRLHRRLGEL